MFVKNEAAIKVGKYLAVADVHIGLTKDVWESGVSLPSQVKSLAGRLNLLRKLTKTENLIIVGDVKHKIVGLSLQEKREVPEFLRLLKFKKIIIVKGNHDGYIEKLTKGSKNVSVKKSYTLNASGIFYVFLMKESKILSKYSLNLSKIYLAENKTFGNAVTGLAGKKSSVNMARYVMMIQIFSRIKLF